MTDTRHVIAMRPERPSAGTATLTLVPDASTVVYLVSVDEQAAAYFGISRRAGTVVGGISRVTDRLWAPVAYTDRDHLFRGGGDVWFLPDLPSRARAARTLARWWWLVDTGHADDLDPADLTPAQWRELTH